MFFGGTKSIEYIKSLNFKNIVNIHLLVGKITCWLECLHFWEQKASLKVFIVASGLGTTGTTQQIETEEKMLYE